MKKLSFLIILILFSCSDSNQVVRTLNTVDSLINERPDSALRLIETIESSSIKERKNRALYALLCTQASYKNYLSIESDSLINTAVEYYKNSGDIEMYGKALLYRGNVLYENKSFDEAIEAYKEAETITTDIQTLALINSNLGWMYSEQMLPDYAIPRLELAVEYFDRIGQRDNATNCLSSIGYTYILLKNYNKAQELFHTALDRATQDKDTVLILQNITSLVINYNTSGNYSLSKHTALATIDKFTQHQIPRGLYVWLIRNYLHENKVDSARYYSNIVKEKTSTVKDSLSYYNMMYLIEKKSNNDKAALYNYENYTRIEDSIAKSLKAERLLEIEQRYDKRLLVSENQRLENISNIHILLIICVILLLILLLSITIVIISNKNRIHRDNLAFIEQLKFAANQTENTLLDKLDKKNEVEMQLKEAIENRMSTIGQLIDLSYQYENSKDNASFKSQFSSIMRIGEWDEGAMKGLPDAVNAKYYGIVDYLKEHYPQLTSSDIILLCLICSGFSPATMTAMYRYENNKTIYSKCSRLATKMNLSIPINRYLNNLIEELKCG